MRADLYVPTDVDEQHEVWGASCGPAAVAALLSREVAAVRSLFEPWPGYTNPTLIKQAITRAGFSARASTERSVLNGLGFVQWEGPWEAGGARAAYRQTHWVALARRPCRNAAPSSLVELYVYDTAAGEEGGWVSIGAFSALITPLYLERKPGATGWRFRSVLEVS